MNPDIDAPNLNDHLGWVDDIHARSLSRRGAGANEKGVDKVWSDTWKGYSGEFDPETIKEIKNSDEVSLVFPNPALHIPATWKAFQSGVLTKPDRSSPSSPSGPSRSTPPRSPRPHPPGALDRSRTASPATASTSTRAVPARAPGPTSSTPASTLPTPNFRAGPSRATTPCPTPRWPTQMATERTAPASSRARLMALPRRPILWL